MQAIQVSKDFQRKALYAHHQADAEDLATKIGVDAYFGLPKDPEFSLEALLNNPDVQALIVHLTPESQPAVIRRALRAGKHVLSASPIARDVETATIILDGYISLGGNTLWGVSESYRFRDAMLYAYQQLGIIGGKVETCSVEVRDVRNSANHST